MSFDFPTFLVLFTFATGIVWAVDAALFAPKRRSKAIEGLGSEAEADPETINKILEDQEPYVVELSRSFFPIVLAVLVVRSFIVEPFRIPSGSMMPSLLVGDFILVNKFAYGIRLPAINTKVIEIDKPKRGDVIVFRYPEDPRIDFIKRVVGEPGDTIAYRNKVLYVNGKRAIQSEIGRYLGTGGGSMMTGAIHLNEDLAGVKHDVLVMPSRPVLDFEFTVPPDEYFVMGDNRDNSRDSRFWGTVPDENLIGKAFMIWMNWDSESDHLISWSRIGNDIN